MRQGIDPSTHRPVVQPSQEQDDITISFTTTNITKQESVSNSDGIAVSDHKEEKNPTLEHCPDLNLELGISPPYQLEVLMKTGGKSSRPLCFTCSLGIRNSKDCICERGCSNDNYNNNNSSTDVYDFLRLQAGVFEFRSLETK